MSKQRRSMCCICFGPREQRQRCDCKAQICAYSRGPEVSAVNNTGRDKSPCRLRAGPRAFDLSLQRAAGKRHREHVHKLFTGTLTSNSAGGGNKSAAVRVGVPVRIKRGAGAGARRPLGVSLPREGPRQRAGGRSRADKHNLHRWLRRSGEDRSHD